MDQTCSLLDEMKGKIRLGHRRKHHLFHSHGEHQSQL